MLMDLFHSFILLFTYSLKSCFGSKTNLKCFSYLMINHLRCLTQNYQFEFESEFEIEFEIEFKSEFEIGFKDTQKEYHLRIFVNVMLL